MEDLSLHVLDIVENSLRSGAKLIEISVVEDAEEDLLSMEIRDNGKGMTAEQCAVATDPFYTTKQGRRIGLGLALLAQAAKEAGGDFIVTSMPSIGTTVKAFFSLSHPDRKPLGDMAATLETLVTGNPGVDFCYQHRQGNECTRFDTREVRKS
jgi:signal transduction histidine kinase